MVFVMRLRFYQGDQKGKNPKNVREWGLVLRFVGGVVMIKREGCTLIKKAKTEICGR